LFKLPNEALVIDLNKSIEHINAIKKGLPVNIAPGTKDCLKFCKKANNKYN
jgi:hypothetical protein